MTKQTIYLSRNKEVSCAWIECHTKQPVEVMRRHENDNGTSVEWTEYKSFGHFLSLSDFQCEALFGFVPEPGTITKVNLKCEQVQ